MTCTTVLRDQVVILGFAMTGIFSVMLAYNYPAGFILTYFKKENVEFVPGILSVQVCQIAAILSPFLLSHFPCNLPLTHRAALLCLITALCSGSLVAVTWLTHAPRLILLGMSRAVLGAACGLLFVIVQGEIIDKFFSESRSLILLVGSGVYAGNIIGGMLGTALFSYRGWLVTAPAIAAFHLLPLVFLMFIGWNYQGEKRPLLEDTGKESRSDRNGIEKERAGASPTDRDNEPELETPVLAAAEPVGDPTTLLSPLQYLAYFVPDLVYLMNSICFAILLYSMPQRMNQYNGEDSNAVFYKLNVICAAVIVPSVLFSCFIGKCVDVTYGLMVSNTVFYIGGLLMYASTTPFLSFPYDFEVSAVLVGLGNASISNLIILSKFVLFGKWMIVCPNLGQHATAVFNVIDAVGQIIGSIISGYILQNRWGIPTLSVFFAFMVVTSFSLVLCRLSYKRVIIS